MAKTDGRIKVKFRGTGRGFCTKAQKRLFSILDNSFLNGENGKKQLCVCVWGGVEIFSFLLSSAGA